MAIQKKHGKGRLDKWYKLAKEKGYRARAAFKLIQLNKKYGFLERSKVLLDLCAAPGSWCQVAAETMPVNSLIVGVDLAPIKPIPKVITFQGDITTDKCRATIRQHLKTWRADTVLHDGAPNVGTAWVQDSFNQSELVLQSMKLATEFLVEGGTFVTKVFRSKDYNSLLWVFNQLFTKVEATKPPSSRNVSAEIFVVCRGYKAPKKIDPKFLDARSVFAELADPTPNNEAKVYNPEVKKRRREGYEEDNQLQFKELPASEFIQTTDPIAILGSYNRLVFQQAKNGDVALAALNGLPETTEDIRTCCADLKVLGRKEFKMLLKWRLRVRDIFGFPSKKTTKEAAEAAAAAAAAAEEVAEVESMDEELKIEEELQALKEKETAKNKRERRRENERKQRGIVRMQMNMTAPMDIGMEQSGPQGDGSMFALKAIDKTAAMGRIARGKMAVLDEAKKNTHESIVVDDGADDDTDEEEDRLEAELEGLYEQYKERKAATDAKYRAKKARTHHDDDEWEGVSADEKVDSDGMELDEDSDDESDGEEPNGVHRPLLTDLDKDEESADANGLSKRARAFFNQDIFKGIPGVLDDVQTNGHSEPVGVGEDEDDDPVVSDDEDAGFEGPQNGLNGTAFEDDSEEVEAVQDGEPDDEESDWEQEEKKRDANKPVDIDIVTAEAMTLAHQLATGQKTKHDTIDDGFNKHAFRDRDGLPDWFIEDESRHDKVQKPITKAAAQAIKEKLRALNARPIKKVREAKARKKFKAAQRLEKLKKKSDILVAEEGMTEKEKADSIQKLLAKAGRKNTRPPVKVVVAKGANRGIKGRPRGVKGRYKIVDARMKKDLRAEKRLAKKRR